MIVVDASALVDAFLYDAVARERLSDEWLCAPFLIDAEFVSSIRWNLRHQNIGADEADTALEEFASVDLLRYGHDWLLGRVWELRDNLTPYDALYVALAEAMDEVLVTGDARLAKATGARARVEVVPLGA